MKIQWHRDRIEKLKHDLAEIRWKMVWLGTGFLALFSIMIAIFVNQEVFLIRFVVIIAGIYMFWDFNKLIRKRYSDVKILNKKISKNYDILLGRKKS